MPETPSLPQLVNTLHRVTTAASKRVLKARLLAEIEQDEKVQDDLETEGDQRDRSSGIT